MKKATRVSFLDLTEQTGRLKDEFERVFRQVLESGRFAGGPEVETFEREFAHFVGAEHAVGVASGTAALRLALRAVGVRPGDDVITVPNTFIATTEAITQVGARVVFCDVDPQRGTMDPEMLRQTITSRTTAVIPVHLYGRVADMDAILAIAAEHGLKVIEDACQAHGARYKGQPAGSFGHAACFSFYPGKNLGALGEAGCVTTNDGSVARTVRLLRDHGQPRKYHHVVEGDNARMDAIQGGILRVKLRHLEDWNMKRRAIAVWYGEGLSEIEEIEVPPCDPAQVECHHLYVIHTCKREALRLALEDAGIQTGLHYPIPLHLQPAYAHLDYREGSFPVTEKLAGELLSLPIYPELKKEAVLTVCREVQRIMDSIRQTVRVAAPVA